MVHRKHPTAQEECHNPVKQTDKAVQTLNEAAKVIGLLGKDGYSFNSEDLNVLRKAHDIVHGQVEKGSLSEAEAPAVKKLDWALETSLKEANFSRMKNDKEIVETIKGLGKAIKRSADTVESACLATAAEAGPAPTAKKSTQNQRQH